MAFLIKAVIFTTLLVIVAEYYQEKYDNNAYAIIVNMVGNSIGVIGILLINFLTNLKCQNIKM